MLTEKELQWLDNRGKFSCWYCPDIPQAMCTMGERPAHCAIMDTDYKDSADFSERVAVKLAINDTSYLPCHQKGHGNQCPYDNYCPTDKKKTAWCKLKHARLQVEEEMDG